MDGDRSLRRCYNDAGAVGGKPGRLAAASSSRSVNRNSLTLTKAEDAVFRLALLHVRANQFVLLIHILSRGVLAERIAGSSIALHTNTEDGRLLKGLKLRTYPNATLPYPAPWSIEVLQRRQA